MAPWLPPTLEALRSELTAVQAAIRAAANAPPGEVALLHRDAVYLALDLGDPAVAMRHALNSLELARAAADRSLQARAHVALALALVDTYDDLGASSHFEEAEHLARAAHDLRGVALVAVNAAHHELDRRRFGAAVRRLHAFLCSEYAAGLDLAEPVALRQTFEINYVLSAAQALAAGELSPDLAPAVEQQLDLSVAALRRLNSGRADLHGSLHGLEMLAALGHHARWRGELDEALRIADERVRQAGTTGSTLQSGRAWLSRSRVQASLQRWEAAILDAQAAVRLFQDGGLEVWLTRAREALAAAYEGAGCFREAFATQREVTRGVEALYAALYQQRALVGQVEQQARDAEVRASAMAEAARRDPLIGIPNRAAALDTLGLLHARAGRGHPSAVAMMDLDHFKEVNDSFGHMVGDAVLIRVAQAITASLRAGDCLARFGGEEFLLIFDGVGPEAARLTCERLRALLAGLDWEDLAPGLRTTASFGVAALDGGAELTATLRAADSALYAAKADGRNRVRVHGGEALSFPLLGAPS